MTMSKKTIIVITGLGGSGTRLYGNIIKNLNIDLGKDINTAYDNLDTFHNTNYYNNIKEKFTFKDYNNWVVDRILNIIEPNSKHKFKVDSKYSFFRIEQKLFYFYC